MALARPFDSHPGCLAALLGGVNGQGPSICAVEHETLSVGASMLAAGRGGAGSTPKFGLLCRGNEDTARLMDTPAPVYGD